MPHSTLLCQGDRSRGRGGRLPVNPLLDNVERIVGFELLTPPEAHPHEATAGVLSQAIADIGLLKLVGDRPADVDVTREFLLLVSPLPLDPERVVLEIAADEHIDDELLAVLREIRAAGFKIALDGFRDGIGERKRCWTSPTA